jgi:hypothetical protein
MLNRNIFKKLPLGLIIIFLLGSFSFAEDKKTLPSNTVNPQQRDCTEDNKKTPNPGSSPLTPKSTRENKGSTPESLTAPSFKIQEDNIEEG